jgi:hypothetical protein
MFMAKGRLERLSERSSSGMGLVAVLTGLALLGLVLWFILNHSEEVPS